MNKFDPNNHHRRSIRLKEYDYSKNGLYFVTICTQSRINLFGEIEEGIMKQNSAGEMIERAWLTMPERCLNMQLYDYVVMPNHFHEIFGLSAGTNRSDIPYKTHTIGTIIGAFKSITTREYIKGMDTMGWMKWENKLWQRNFYEHIIRTPDAFDKIREYIINNPMHWDEDENNIMI